MFPPKKHQKVITGLLNSCGILWISFRPLEYIIKFPTKLLVKLHFGNFWIFLKFCLLFKIFPPQKPSKNHHRCLKRIQRFPKLLVSMKIHVEGFDKIVRLSIFVIFAHIFKIIFSFHSVWAHKVPKNRHRSLEWVWYCLSSILSFTVYIKISDKIVS